MQRFPIDVWLNHSQPAAFPETTVARVLVGLPPPLHPTPDGPWLCGGAVRHLSAGTEPDSDYDFFFKSEDGLSAAKAALVAAGWSVRRESEHNITLVGAVADVGGEQIVQLIRTNFFETIDGVLDSFDFTICQFGFDGADIVMGPFSAWDLARKRIAVHRITFAASSVRRLLKYAAKGFTVCQGAAVTLLNAVAADPSVIRSDVQYVD